MSEISLNNYNEMVRYERDMDRLRALALWITLYGDDRDIPSLPNPKEHVFDLIGYYSISFASDIYNNGSITIDALSRFNSSLNTINSVLGISKEDIERAGEQQRYRNCGFWEMRRGLGQFTDIAESASNDKVTHIITAAVSGCIIGEYLGLVMANKFQYEIPVSHMIFSRDGIEPIGVHLPEHFSFSGNHFLIVDDAVMETNTSTLMIQKIKELDSKAMISLFTVDISQEAEDSEYLNQFAHVYTFEE